mgnify:CR=1 FL=1
MKNSVIIPVYNTEKYLEQCVSSVLEQPEAEEIEIILIDDGSTDGSGNICDNFEKNDKRVIVIHQTNRGQAAARNAGLKIAKGQYVFFLDSDDFWTPNTYPEIVKQLKMRKPDLMLFSMMSYYDGRKEEVFFDCKKEINIGKDDSAQLVLKKYLERDYSFGWCPVWYAVKNEMIQTHGIKYPEGYLSEDVYFSFLLWEYASKVDATETFLYNYRRDNINSTTHKATFKFSNDLLQMIKRNLAIAKEQISDPELLGLVKLNLQTLVNVVLFWYTSYTQEEQKRLKETIFEIKEIYRVEPEAKKYMRKKEKLINVLLLTIGVTCTATLWGLKRKKHIK